MTLALMLTAMTDASAQAHRRENRRGNRALKVEDYDDAIKHYNLGVMKDPSGEVVLKYNIAYALHNDRRNPEMNMAKDSLALRYLDEIAESVVGTEYEYGYHFNKGVIAIDMEDWQSAVDEFKKCMIMNPDDMLAKENYIYAKEHLKNQQNQQNQQDQQDQNDQQDQQDQNDQQGDQNQQDQQGEQNQDNKQNQQQPQGQKMSPQAAKQILQAMQAKEKETQEKVEKEKNAAVGIKQKGKNW